jgi:hypothetical protein
MAENASNIIVLLTQAIAKALSAAGSEPLSGRAMDAPVNSRFVFRVSLASLGPIPVSSIAQGPAEQ